MESWLIRRNRRRVILTFAVAAIVIAAGFSTILDDVKNDSALDVSLAYSAETSPPCPDDDIGEAYCGNIREDTRDKSGRPIDDFSPFSTTLIADAGGPYRGDEGSAIALVGATAPGPNEGKPTFRWSVDSGLCRFSDSSARHPTITCSDNGTFTATLTVENGTAVVTDNAIITVFNVPPEIETISVSTDPVWEGAEIVASAKFTDAGSGDTHTAEWDWGDSISGPGAVSKTGGSGAVSNNHTYRFAGVYAITLTVTDKDNGSDADKYEFVVVYDPDDASVTGAGWIDSPPGACPVLCGTDAIRGSFGFISMYNETVIPPIILSDFRFKAGDLNFHSTNYEILVLTRPHVKFLGTGTINGEGDYGFMIAATDGDISDVNDADGFRIKVWDEDDRGNVVYDNQMDEPDGSTKTTVLGGGSIVIHTKE